VAKTGHLNCCRVTPENTNVPNPPDLKAKIAFWKMNREKTKWKENWEILNFKLGGNGTFFALSKIPRQCPLYLIVGETLREGKALGSEEVKIQFIDLIDC
jgi:hypothetical protein